MIKGEFRIFSYGNSLGMRLPKNLNHTDYATAAIEDLVLADPTGEVPDDILVGWLNEIEGKRIDWLRIKKTKKNQLKIL